MGNFNGGKRFDGGGGNKFTRNGGGRSFGNDRTQSRGFGGGGDRPAVMHSATCSDCGKGCEVPFRPSGDKPVYCSDCFRNNRGGDSVQRNSRDGGRRDFGTRDSRPRFEEKKYSQSVGQSGGESTKAQFDLIHARLDQIIDLLKSGVVGVPATVPPETEMHKPVRAGKVPKKEVDMDVLKDTLQQVVGEDVLRKKQKSKKAVAKKSGKK